MRLFCTQPDIIEDVPALRYNTHTKAKSASSAGSPPKVVPFSSSNNNANPPPATEGNRSRTNLHNVFSSKKFFHSQSYSSEQRKLSIGAPVPISTPNINATPIANPIGNPPASNASLPAAKPKSFDGKPKNIEIKPKSFDGDSKALTDTEGLGFRRKSRRMSAPFSALKFGGGGEESGTDTGGKKYRRVSKLAIGTPAGFKHEGHVGVGETFMTAPQDRDTWDVETWRAEIERTLKHTSTSPTIASRPKGPRPSSVSPDPSPPRRHRGSVDGAAPPRWSVDSKRDREPGPRWSAERERSRDRERDGTVSDYPIGRPMTAPHRGSVSSHASARHSRSRSGSAAQQQTAANNPVIAASTAAANSAAAPPQVVGIHTGSLRGPRLALGDGQVTMGHVHGHVPGKESITSLASTPTTVTTQSSNNTIITPTTTTTSLSRSLSDKPFYSHHPHQRPAVPQQGYHHQQQQQSGGGNSDYEWTYNSNNHLQRASSANAAAAGGPRYPPSSSVSTSTTASSVASHGSSTTATAATRRPIPAQKRKPVPQHLPPPIEVSPFPTLLVVKDSNTPTNPSFPFDINPAVEKRERKRTLDEEEKRKGWRDESGQIVKKEMVPLLGAPTEGAQYVTKSTKARWDGAMAEIANALRDPEAVPPV